MTITGPGYPSTDAAFATALKDGRDQAGLTQEDLAAQMRERGFSFHQATIYKIEVGSRKVTVAEASALAAIVNLPLQFMIGATPYVRDSLISEARELLDHQLAAMDELGGIYACQQDLRLYIDRWETEHGDEAFGQGAAPRELFAPLLEWKPLDAVEAAWKELLEDETYLRAASAVGVDVRALWENRA